MTTVTIEFDPPHGEQRLRKLVIPDAYVEGLIFTTTREEVRLFSGRPVPTPSVTTIDLEVRAHGYTVEVDNPSGDWIDAEVVDEFDTPVPPRVKEIEGR